MRLVLENAMGHRIAIDEAAYDDPEANPHNHDHIDFTDVGGASRHAGLKGADRKSLKDAGWKAVATIEADGTETPLKGGR